MNIAGIGADMEAPKGFAGQLQSNPKAMALQAPPSEGLATVARDNKPELVMLSEQMDVQLSINEDLFERLRNKISPVTQDAPPKGEETNPEVARMTDLGRMMQSKVTRLGRSNQAMVELLDRIDL